MQRYRRATVSGFRSNHLRAAGERLLLTAAACCMHDVGRPNHDRCMHRDQQRDKRARTNGFPGLLAAGGGFRDSDDVPSHSAYGACKVNPVGGADD
jgi:hypothetical protein